jgi:outer membrane protein OmpA-like peptidoglycan-associated protein
VTKTAYISGTTVSNIAGVFAAIVVGVLSASYAPMGVAKDTPNADVVTSSTSGSAPSMPLPPATQPPPILAFDEAVAHVTTAVFSTAPSADAAVIPVVIDPLIDGLTGYQSKATQSIQDRIAAIVKKDFPQYAVQRIAPESLSQQPRVLIGTFTPRNAQKKTSGQRDTYWFCLVMLDLRTGKVVAKSVAWVRVEGSDVTPTASFGDSPAWTDDPSTLAYVASCQGSKVGDPINPEYLDGLLTAAVISEADDAYDEARYSEALNLYTTARKTRAGDQLRVYNGVYLSLFKLGRADQAAGAFHDLVDYGFRKKRLAVKFLFRPGSVRFANDSEFSASYPLWLQQIASQALSSQACLQIIGHTSPAGSAALNDSLSLLRAQYIQSQLEDAKPPLKSRTVAAGVGSRENLIGTGRDDTTDILDRRVELKPINSCG